MSVEAPETTQAALRPPRDNLYRAVAPLELRADGGEGEDGPVLTGHFAVFDQWTEIDSIFEGNFLERFAPGAFRKTISENREAMRVLFQHGFDPQLGDKPLGPIRSLEEDSEGVYYEVPLLDASYVRDDVLPGLQEGLYGASFRFRVVREDFNREPGESEHNPEGIPERTVKEAMVMEFGPVTFPAYDGASAGIRSLSDEMVAARFAQDPERLKALLDNFTSRSIAAPAEEAEEREDGESAEPEKRTAPSETDSAGSETHPAAERREDRTPLYGVPQTKSAKPSWRL